MYHIFIHSSVDGQLHRLHVLTTISSAAVNTENTPFLMVSAWLNPMGNQKVHKSLSQCGEVENDMYYF